MRRWMLILGIGLSLAACASEPPITGEPAALATSPVPESLTPLSTNSEITPLAVVQRHGGLCPEGECQSTLMIATDGSYYTDAGRWGVEADGTFSADQMTVLRGLIQQTDFAAIKAVPFTDTCPTAVDGQEVIYLIYTAAGEERLASCEVVIDPTLPLFAWLDAVMAEVTTP